MNNLKPSLSVKYSLLFTSVNQTRTSVGVAMIAAAARKEKVKPEALAKGIQEVFANGVK